jgi:hypothetical protein
MRTFITLYFSPSISSVTPRRLRLEGDVTYKEKKRNAERGHWLKTPRTKQNTWKTQMQMEENLYCND